MAELARPPPQALFFLSLSAATATAVRCNRAIEQGDRDGIGTVQVRRRTTDGGRRAELQIQDTEERERQVCSSE